MVISQKECHTTKTRRTMYKHINFTVYPDYDRNWGKMRTVNISIPKSKYKSLKQVKEIWFAKTGNIAMKIVKGDEKYVG
jgi:hypothetical protein